LRCRPMPAASIQHGGFAAMANYTHIDMMAQLSCNLPAPGCDRAAAISDPGPLDPPPRTPAHACVQPDRRRSTGVAPLLRGHVDARYGCNVETPAVQSRLVNGRVRPGVAGRRRRGIFREATVDEATGAW
jgi:hypothetical protein